MLVAFLKHRKQGSTEQSTIGTAVERFGGNEASAGAATHVLPVEIPCGGTEYNAAHGHPMLFSELLHR